MAAVSVLDFSRVKVFDDAIRGAGDEEPDDLAAEDVDVFLDACVCLGGRSWTSERAVEGRGVGFDPPMLSVIVGGGRGASVCAGRSTGGGGG